MVADLRERQTAADVVENIYIALEKSISPGTLDRFLKNAYYAKGSRSVHGFIVMLKEHHEFVKQKKSGRMKDYGGRRVLTGVDDAVDK